MDTGVPVLRDLLVRGVCAHRGGRRDVLGDGRSALRSHGCATPRAGGRGDVGTACLRTRDAARSRAVRPTRRPR